MKMKNPQEFINIRKLSRRTTGFTVQDHHEILWIADGLIEITVDFQTLPFYPYSILFLTPGRVVKLSFSDNQPRGWIMEIPKDYLRRQLPDGLMLKNIDLFQTISEVPRIVLSPKIGERVHTIAEMISELNGSTIPNKDLAISALLRTMLVYCDSKCNIRLEYRSKNSNMNIVSRYKDHVSKHFPEIHKVSAYAARLNVTPKYLTQVVKQVMGVTAKQIIHEQLLIQACRDLKFSNDNVSEIAYRLGFSEPEHFSHFFKKSTGQSPSQYRQM